MNNKPIMFGKRLSFGMPTREEIGLLQQRLGQKYGDEVLISWAAKINDFTVLTLSKDGEKRHKYFVDFDNAILYPVIETDAGERRIDTRPENVIQL